LVKWSRTIQEIVIAEGACVSGTSAVETLAGGPPTCDRSCDPPGAQSAITLAVAINQVTVPPYLMKKDRLAFEQAHLRANTLVGSIAFLLADHLNPSGHPLVPVSANLAYRPDGPECGGPARCTRSDAR